MTGEKIMNYLNHQTKTVFPEILKAKGFKDCSWKNDKCGSLCHPEIDELHIYPVYDCLSEECPLEPKLWQVFNHAENWSLGEFTPEGVARLFNDIYLISSKFSETLHQWLGEETMRKVVELNRSYIGTKDEGCCASGDFCDSNMAMLEAFELVLGREFIYSYEDETGEESPELFAKHEADCNLWNTAWAVAKKKEFKS